MSHTQSTRQLQLSRQGFTLTEMLVAVGAMALLALGIAQVFSLTTRTVAAGRRLSNLNAVASATERQMRADIAAMTSRGVLLIRNEKANGGAQVEAYSADPDRRVRRIDELLFTATGQFTSTQQPVTADGTPVSSPEAIIYYGHGARQDPLAPGNSGYTTPVDVADTNASAPQLGVDQGPGGSKVNLYASEWTLVRRAFVMAPPARQQNRVIPGGQGFGGQITIQDTATQIAGLPAAPSPNRYDASNWSSLSLFGPNIALRGSTMPALSSGAVDIVAMDLRGMAAQLQDVLSGGNGGYAGFMSPTSNQLPVGSGGGGLLGGSSAYYQQAWIRCLLPANSDAGRRIRVEPSAPDFINMRGGASLPYNRADQLMLGAGAFLPRCSEFIVEYSFGAARTGANTTGTTNIGAVFWHGLDRQTGVNSDANDYANHVRRYADLVSVSPDVVNSTAITIAARRPETIRSGDPVAMRIALNPALVEPENILNLEGGADWNYTGNSSYALFGITNPLYAPPTNMVAKDVDGDGNYDWADGDVLQFPESIPWARPKLLRITFSICDPTDPSIEQTFQFVLEVPSDTRSPAM